MGTGNIARLFAQGLASVPGAELVGVGSRTLESAAAFAARFGVPRAYGSYRELVDADNVDVVYIATLNHRHKEDCFLCLDAGKAVLCEKPLALNARDAREMVTRARARGVFLMEAMWMRFIPLIQKARELLHAGEIGKPCLLFADFGYPVERNPQNRFLNPQLGGGSLLDRGIYPLSLAWYLLGAPKEITGQATIGLTGVDEQSVALLNYEDGAQAVLSSTLKAFGPNRATVVGTHGHIEIKAPFFRTEHLVVTRFPVANPRLTPAGIVVSTSHESSLVRTVRRFQRATLRLLRKNPDRVSYAFPLQGNGYNYEAAEVGRCLRASLLESPVMPQSESIAMSEAMDALRARWGMVYPNDP